MPKTILPPAAETFLSSETGVQVSSAMRDVYENIMVDTATNIQLTQLGIDLAVNRPPVLFSDDNLWRAIVKNTAYGPRHTREAVARFIELVIGPKVSQVTTLDRVHYRHVTIGNTLNITSGLNVGAYVVDEVLTHHLIFPNGTFLGGIPEQNISYNITNLSSSYGNIVSLSDGREALVDTTVSFVNTHPSDFLTKLNTDIPQYGTVIFDKNSSWSAPLSQTTEQSFNYGFYDKDLSGILKLTEEQVTSSVTRNKYTSIRNSRLSNSVSAGSLSLSLLNGAAFPKSDELVPTINTADVIRVIPPGSVYASGNLDIISVSPHQIVVNGATPFPVVPASPSTTDVIYEITAPAYGGPPAHPAGSLDNGRGYFLSRKGHIINTTTLVDYTVDFTKLIKPYTDGTVGTLSSPHGNGNISEPFSIVINRGGNNEETLEVLYRETNVLHLVPDPKDLLGETSLLNFDHAQGEIVEVFNATTEVTGTYYPLDATGTVTGVADAGSTDVILLDVGATFVMQNADASYGDELEVTIDPTGNNAGLRRTIVTFTGANQVEVGIAFPTTLAGCTYRIRKLYKARPGPLTVITNEDQYLYVTDSTIFPEADATIGKGFSVILDRGTSQEEVVWITENEIVRNRLLIGSGNWGTPGSPNPYLSKDHNFGMTVEAAQLLIESCKWEIIETQATGKFSVAAEEECVPDIGKQGWYLHEKTPTTLLDNSSFGAIAPVDGSVGIPFAPIVIDISAGDSSISITLDNFIRVLANPTFSPFGQFTKTPELVFRAALLTDVGNGNEEEVFVTTANLVGQLFENITPSGTTIITNVEYVAGTVLRIGTYRSAYPGQSESVTVAPAGPTFNITTELWETPLVAAPTYDHFYGESVIPAWLTINVRSLLTQPFSAASTRLSLLTAHEHYRHIDDISLTTTRVASGGTISSIEQVGTQFTQDLVGKEVYIVSAGGAAPEGESRRIVAIAGPLSNTLMVQPPFSAIVQNLDGFILQPTLQTGDISSDAVSVVPLGTVNPAFPASLNGLVNPNKWAGGHRSVYPGSYMFRTINALMDDTVDQPKSTGGTVWSAPNPTDKTAIYKFPGPKKLIAEPFLPYGVAGNVVADTTKLMVDFGVSTQINAIPAGDPPITDYTLEILGPNTRIDWRTVHRIVGWNGLDTLTLDPPLSEDAVAAGPDITKYRILGIGDALTPLNTGYFWVDYPDLFPDPDQDDFYVTLDRANGGEEVKVVVCVNTLGALYGRFTIDPIENIAGSYPSGTTVELKVNKFTLNTPATPLTEGGFYLEFGFQKEVIKDVNVGLGNSVTNETTDKIIAGVHHPGEYSYEKGVSNSILHGKYTIPYGGLKQAANSLSTPIMRSQIETVISNSAILCILQLTNINFNDDLDKTYKDLIGASVITTFSSLDPTVSNALVYTVSHVIPSSNALVITPGIAVGAVPVASIAIEGSPIEIHPTNTRVDDQERFDSPPYLLKGMGVAAPLSNNYSAFAGGTIDWFPVNRPASKALIGRSVVVTATSGLGPPVGEETTIVDVILTGVGPPATFAIWVSPPFTGAATADLVVSVTDNNAFMPRFRSRVGGVTTGINDPNGIAPTFTKYPAGREYGIVEEYIEYISQVSSIYTTATPHYFMYDHPPGTKVMVGSGVRTTEGFGNDYRPYILDDFLSVVFNSDVVDVKNLFCAAGIEVKTEITELGS